MNIGKARAIFEQIDNDKYSVEEKGMAILKIISMPTDNSVRKEYYKRALAWLWNEHFELEEQEDE